MVVAASTCRTRLGSTGPKVAVSVPIMATTCPNTVASTEGTEGWWRERCTGEKAGTGRSTGRSSSPRALRPL